MNPLYNIGIDAYALAARLAAVRSPKVAQMIDGQRHALRHIAGVMQSRQISHFDYWFHAASLGEFEQARPLIEEIRSNRSDSRILLTFFSPSGYNVRHDYPLVDCVAYLPFDTQRNAADFVALVRPGKAVFIKYEFWGNYLQTLHKADIPLYLVSAIFRPSQIFFKPWGGQFRDILRCYTHIFVQDERSARLLHGIGIDKVTVAGDTRFDRVAKIACDAKPIPQIQQWIRPDDFVIVVGSSWPLDEDRYIPFLNNHPRIKTIIAPHEFDETRIHRLMARLSNKTMLFSQTSSDTPVPADVSNLIIDNFGLLASLYRYATVAIVGGGFGAGIHNINEAAAHGVPVIFGPNHAKFKEATDMLAITPVPAAMTYTTAAGLAAILNTYLSDPERLAAARHAAGDYITSNLGATPRILPSLL